MLCHDSEGGDMGGVSSPTRQLKQSRPRWGSEGPIVKKPSLDYSWGEKMLLHAMSDMYHGRMPLFRWALCLVHSSTVLAEEHRETHAPV